MFTLDRPFIRLQKGYGHAEVFPDFQSMDSLDAYIKDDLRRNGYKRRARRHISRAFCAAFRNTMDYNNGEEGKPVYVAWLISKGKKPSVIIQIAGNMYVPYSESNGDGNKDAMSRVGMMHRHVHDANFSIVNNAEGERICTKVTMTYKK